MLLKSLLKFALAGPAIGGLVAFAFISVAVFLPELFVDPLNTFGHNRQTEFVGTLALVVLFCYPIGLFPALAAGLAYHLMRQRIYSNRIGSIFVVCLAGVVAMAIEQSLFTGTASLLTLSVAAISAATLSLYVSRPARLRAASSFHRGHVKR